MEEMRQRQSHKQVAVGIPIYTRHCVVGIEEDSCSKGINIFKRLTTENFPELGKDINLHAGDI